MIQAAAGRGRHDHRVDINNSKKEWGERFGMTHFVNPTEIDGDIVPYLVNLTNGGAT